MNPTRQDVENLIRIVAPTYGLDPAVEIRQCEAESSFSQEARSPCGAIGLMQLMPATAHGLGVDPSDWKQNLAGGMKYMGQLLRQFGSIDKALAGYNWGPGHVEHLLANNPDDWRAHLPTETSNYLNRILG